MKKEKWKYNHFVIIVALLLSLQFVLTLNINLKTQLNVNVQAAVKISGFSGGDGTASSPYLISTVSNLQNLSNHVNGGGSTYNTYFKLTENLDISNYSFQIGTLKSDATYYFEGIFDGNYKVIYNFSINNSSTYSGDLGLFGYLKGTIMNLKMYGGSVTLTKPDKSAGAFVGSMYENSSIINCHNLGCNVTSDEISGSSNIGGIVGYSAGGDISLCCNFADIDNKSTKNAYSGGIVGNAEGNPNINKCYNSGSISAGYLYKILHLITSGTKQAYSGGISGKGGKISYCYNTGDIVSESKAYYTITTYVYMYYESVWLVGGGLIGSRDGVCSVSYTSTYSNAQSFGIANNALSVKSSYNIGKIISSGSNTITFDQFRELSYEHLIYNIVVDNLGNYMSTNNVKTKWDKLVSNGEQGSGNMLDTSVIWPALNRWFVGFLYPTSYGADYTINGQGYKKTSSALSSSYVSGITNSNRKVAITNSSNVSNSFYINDCNGTGYGTSKTSNEIKNLIQTNVFNSSIWSIDKTGIINNGYPYLKDMFWSGNASNY